MLGCDVAEHLCMVVQNSWLSSDTLSECRARLLKYGLRKIENYPKYGEVFKGVNTSVSFICADRGYTGETEYTEVKNSKKVENYNHDIRNLKYIPSSIEQYTILEKLGQCKTSKFEKNIGILNFGIATDGKYMSGSREHIKKSNVKCGKFNVGILMLQDRKTAWQYVPDEEIRSNRECIKKYNVVCGEKMHRSRKCITNIQKLGLNQICSQSFSVIYSCESENVADNAVKYVKSRFFRFLVRASIDDRCQVAASRFKYVPNQDFTSSNTAIDWSKSVDDIDKQLYKKYNLEPDEIEYIEKTMLPME